MFENAFWTRDYETGIRLLFEALRRGCEESALVASLIAERIDLEKAYALRIKTFADSQRPESTLTYLVGRSLPSRATNALLRESEKAALERAENAEHMAKTVLEPLQQYNQNHCKRVFMCKARLNKLLAGYQRRRSLVNKLKRAYNERGNNGEATEPRSLVSALRVFTSKCSIRDSLSLERLQSSEFDPDSHRGSLLVAGINYTREEFSTLMAGIFADVQIGAVETPLFGRYDNVSDGAAIAAAARRNLQNDSIAYSEKFGQALVVKGFLRPVAQISNRFQATRDAMYQWQPTAYALAADAKLDKEIIIGRSTSPSSIPSPMKPLRLGESQDSAEIAKPSNPYAEHYYNAVVDLDVYRCNMEIDIEKSLILLENYESEHIVAVTEALDKLAVNLKIDRSVTLNVNPQQEIERFVKAYQTGPFLPTVTVFEAHEKEYCQVFGVDLEHSSYFPQLVLDHLNGQDVPIEAWLSPIDLPQVYKIRLLYNEREHIDQLKKNMGRYDFGSFVQILRQYFLELPESLLPSSVYDSVKLLYETDLEKSDRISNATVILSQLQTCNITLLRQLALFLANYKNPRELALALSLCLFRPRVTSVYTREDAHPKLFLEDLFENAQEICDLLDKSQAEKNLQKSELGTPTRHNRDKPAFRSPKYYQERYASLQHEQNSGNTSLLPFSLAQNFNESGTLKVHTGQRPLRIPSGVLPVGEPAAPTRTPTPKN